ncbi:MAG: hypothetical protein ACLFU8_15735 [Anaerolineales bacterium]
MVNVQVRSARLQDAKQIASFVNKARPGGDVVNRLRVAERFSDVGFLLAEQKEQLVGILGWQVENLVVRVTDFLVAPAVDRVVAGRALISEMEAAAKTLQAEAAILFLPENPSQELVEFWELFDYQRRKVVNLNRYWREAVQEWSNSTSEVMIKQLREGLVSRPI